VSRAAAEQGCIVLVSFDQTAAESALSCLPSTRTASVRRSALRRVSARLLRREEHALADLHLEPAHVCVHAVRVERPCEHGGAVREAHTLEVGVEVIHACRLEAILHSV
jgi:hypothetical protein